MNLSKSLSDIGPLSFPGMESGLPLVIAGPCSAESEQQTLETARALSAIGVKFYRAGIWKPRTMPGSFEGIGDEGLQWLQAVKRETGMMVATEVATVEHVRAALDAGIDILWIGARTTANPFAVQDIADQLQGHDEITVLVKNPVNPCNGSAMRVSRGWVPCIVDSARQEHTSTATIPCGTSPSSCAVLHLA